MITFGDLRGLALFDGVPDDKLASLLSASDEVVLVPGDRLWEMGDPAEFWWVLVDGTIDLVRRAGREESVVGHFAAPGRWAGGFRAWDEDGTYLATGRAGSAGRVLKVPAPALRALLAGVPLVGHLIDGLFHTARNIEASSRQRESLVALGTLAAGLAHELNNPAAAAIRAVDSLDEATAELLAFLGHLAAASISADQFEAIDVLRREMHPPAAGLDAMAVADLEDDLATWMDQRGFESGWRLAPPLAGAGADVAWCERVADIVQGQALEAAFGWITSTVLMTTLLSEVRESTQRISNLVGAVKSYSQLDRASMQQTDVTEGLDSTLVMLGHQLGEHVTVVRDYGADLPSIEAIPGELNQVWTNLIDNAIDAMDGEGVLTLSTRLDGDAIVVGVADTGPGMSETVRENAFRPFYTTKDVGKGTGLGLDISRRIVVERHGGRITIDSEPGRTVINVRLLIRPAA